MREWIYGRNPVYEVMRAGRRRFFRLMVIHGVQEKGRLAETICACEAKKIPVERVNRHQLDQIAANHQGVALEATPYPYCALPDITGRAQDLGEDPFILILDALQDPQNLGTLLRTAEAVGVHGVLLPLRHTATVTPAVVSASSGACEHLLVAQVNLAQAIDTLKQAGIWVIGLEGSDAAQRPERINLSGPIALVIGNEGQGMRPLVRDSCDLLMSLPMRGKVESLNASVAGSIALYFSWQARGFLSGKN